MCNDAPHQELSTKLTTFNIAAAFMLINMFNSATTIYSMSQRKLALARYCNAPQIFKWTKGLNDSY